MKLRSSVFLSATMMYCTEQSKCPASQCPGARWPTISVRPAGIQVLWVMFHSASILDRKFFWVPSILGALIGHKNLIGSKCYGVSFIVASIILGSDYHRPYCVQHDFKVACICLGSLHHFSFHHFLNPNIMGSVSLCKVYNIII